MCSISITNNFIRGIACVFTILVCVLQSHAEEVKYSGCAIDGDRMVFLFVPVLDRQLTSDDLFEVKPDPELSEILFVPLRELRQATAFTNAFAKDLDVTEGQMQQIVKANEEVAAALEVIAVGIQQKTLNPKDAKKLCKELASQIKEIKSEVFLDFQVERGRELFLGWKLNMDPLVKSLESDEFREKLRITDAQIAAMKKLKPELENDFVKRTTEIADKYRAKVLDELNADQRKKVEKKLGPPSVMRTLNSRYYLLRLLNL